MKRQLNPGPYRAVLFDIDNTLYRDDRYAQWQIDVLIRRFADHRGMAEPEALRLVAETRSRLTANAGRRPSLGNTMVALGVPISTSVDWRRELITPHRFLQRDETLRAPMERLAAHVRLAVLTNNPEDVGRASLDALGFSDLIPTVVGLDTTWASKPDWAPFQAALDAVGAPVEATVMVGDRWDVDLAPIVERGGSGILVESHEDLREAITMLLEA